MVSRQNIFLCQVLNRLTKISNLRGAFLLIAYSIIFTKSKLCDRSLLLGKINKVTNDYLLVSKPLLVSHPLYERL